MPAGDGFEAVIGLEVHAQLRTATKIFCACRAEYGARPNSLTCPVCLGLPGALPVLNRRAVDLALRLILAVGGEVQPRSVFARKNYFYPDLPKGYQISQYDRPLGLGGQIAYELDSGEAGHCRLERIHLEEDAGKSLHPEHGEMHTRVDLNRCGVPLAEIVSKPEIHSPQQAHAYLAKLRQILRYTEVCSGDMEKGHLRCDANISVRPLGQESFGTRTELKNMNSFRGVERALRFEVDRQVKVIKGGGTVEAMTLLWDEKKQVAEPMRSKETAMDYRYFPEPDLPELIISKEWLEEVRGTLPELPDARRARLIADYGLRPADASVLTADHEVVDFFEAVMRHTGRARAAANWMQTELLGAVRDSGADFANYPIRPHHIAGLVNEVGSGRISGKMAKTVFAEMVTRADAVLNDADKTLTMEPQSIIHEKGLALISDAAELTPVVDRVLKDFGDEVLAYRRGKTGLLAFFVGQVMKATRGQGDPQTVNRLLKERLDR